MAKGGTVASDRSGRGGRKTASSKIFCLPDTIVSKIVSLLKEPKVALCLNKLLLVCLLICLSNS